MPAAHGPSEPKAALYVTQVSSSHCLLVLTAPVVLPASWIWSGTTKE